MAVIHGHRPRPKLEPALTDPITADEIKDKMRQMAGASSSIFVPEFTWGDLRIDALLLETRKRWIRGFEIKVSRGDFLQDDKWQLYSQFCSSLSVGCPYGLIKPDEVPAPYGLAYFKRVGGFIGLEITWVKKPRRFQRRDSMAWLWTYLRVLEMEMPRLQAENFGKVMAMEYRDRRIAELEYQLEKKGRLKK
jgi:hypothetical protein